MLGRMMPQNPHTNITLSEVQDKLRDAAAQDFDQACPIPPEVIAEVSDADREAYVAEFRRYLIVANDEDKALVEALHRGSSSPLLPQGTYHPIERNLWQFMRYLAGRCQ